MASAQAMEEELQQSVLLSEDAEYDTADSDADNHTNPTGRKNKGGVTDSAQYGAAGVPRDEGSDDEELSDRDASGEEIDEDASGEEDNDLLAQQIIVGDAAGDEDEDEDDENDEDAERDDDLDEGVGAVKIRPGESDDEDIESDVSDLPSAPDEESDEDEAAWEDGDGADGDEDEDEDEDAAPSNTCMFCKQDEENDPSEDFEAFLTCTGCGENGMWPHPSAAKRLANCNSPSTMCPRCGSH